MSTAILDLPTDVQLREGETFSWQIEGVARGGKLVVQHFSKREVPVSGPPLDRRAAVNAFLEKWSGALSGELSEATDQQLDDARWEYLKEKHLK
jgi:hypothetical protein